MDEDSEPETDRGRRTPRPSDREGAAVEADGSCHTPCLPDVPDRVQDVLGDARRPRDEFEGVRLEKDRFRDDERPVDAPGEPCGGYSVHCPSGVRPPDADMSDRDRDRDGVRPDETVEPVQPEVPDRDREVPEVPDRDRDVVHDVLGEARRS
ncbi:hypothetical protein WJX74_005259 [Apatococcus lobatus]|uniref:Uncharacterized protein n=1 Tax=Apatococcus lobatus TaxID=904363 RepID=A0AAW1Q5K1_9CHLO